jgi:hypothetical protein
MFVHVIFVCVCVCVWVSYICMRIRIWTLTHDCVNVNMDVCIAGATYSKGSSRAGSRRPSIALTHTRNAVRGASSGTNHNNSKVSVCVFVRMSAHIHVHNL